MNTTRTISLWLNNEEGSYKHIRSAANDAMESAILGESHAPTARNEAVEDLAGTIRDMVEADMPDVDGMWQELCNDAVRACDFEEIAKGFVDEIDIWVLFSSDDEEAELFTELDLVIERLCEMFEDTGDKAEYVQNMGEDDMVEIEGTTYTIKVNRG